MEDRLLEAIKNLKSRVQKEYSTMNTLELSLALLAIRIDDIGLDYSVVNDGNDPYGRSDIGEYLY